MFLGIFLNICLFLFCVYGNFAWMYVCAPCLHTVSGESIISLELKLQKVISHCVSTRDRTLVLWKISQCSHQINQLSGFCFCVPLHYDFPSLSCWFWEGNFGMEWKCHWSASVMFTAFRKWEEQFKKNTSNLDITKKQQKIKDLPLKKPNLSLCKIYQEKEIKQTNDSHVLWIPWGHFINHCSAVHSLCHPSHSPLLHSSILCWLSLKLPAGLEFKGSLF